MKILVVGSGGREHTIIWKLLQSEKVTKVFCAPGNGGISEIAECFDVSVMDIEGMIKLAKEKEVDLVVVAPDDPLAAGMVNAMEMSGIRAFGSSKEASIIEASKAYSKDLMKKYNIPTAAYEIFSNSNDAIKYLKNQKFPIVIKADGLALGKGVLICKDLDEAIQGIKQIMEEKKFGVSGSKVVIEEFLTGPEVSILAFCDGKTIVPMVSAQDHKRAFDNDEGLNTGGMGTFTPSLAYTDEIALQCIKKIYKPTIEAMKKENRVFKGILFFGLMITEDGPKVIEYNARFGDPETQVVLPRLETDLLDIFNAIIDEKLHTVDVKWNDDTVVCVVLASGGYPVKYNKGYEITGIKDAISQDDIIVFHAGTKYDEKRLLTNGGRVLGVTASGDNMENAREKAYEAVSKINFKDVHYRTDIGIK